MYILSALVYFKEPCYWKRRFYNLPRSIDSCQPAFSPFSPQYFRPFRNKISFFFLFKFILSSANAFNLDQSKILSFDGLFDLSIQFCCKTKWILWIQKHGSMRNMSVLIPFDKHTGKFNRNK